MHCWSLIISSLLRPMWVLQMHRELQWLSFGNSFSLKISPPWKHVLFLGLLHWDGTRAWSPARDLSVKLLLLVSSALQNVGVMALSLDLTVGFLVWGKLLPVPRSSGGSLPGGLAQSWVTGDKVWTKQGHYLCFRGSLNHCGYCEVYSQYFIRLAWVSCRKGFVCKAHNVWGETVHFNSQHTLRMAANLNKMKKKSWCILKLILIKAFPFISPKPWISSFILPQIWVGAGGGTDSETARWPCAVHSWAWHGAERSKAGKAGSCHLLATGYGLLLGLVPQPPEKQWGWNPHGIVLEVTSPLGHPAGRDQGPDGRQDTFSWERSACSSACKAWYKHQLL